MCTTSEIPANFHTNHKNIFDIKEESEGYDTITFEDYKITESYLNENIKEEPVDCYEIVELTDVFGVHSSLQSKVHSTVDITDHQNERTHDSKDNDEHEWSEKRQNHEQIFKDNIQSCNEDEELNEQLGDNILDVDCKNEHKQEHFELNGTNHEQYLQKSSKQNQINNKDQESKLIKMWPELQHKQLVNSPVKFEENVKTEPEDDSTIITKMFSIKDHKFFLFHDHSYYQTFKAHLLNKFDCDDDDDGESSQEDAEVETGKSKFSTKLRHNKTLDTEFNDRTKHIKRLKTKLISEKDKEYPKIAKIIKNASTFQNNNKESSNFSSESSEDSISSQSDSKYNKNDSSSESNDSMDEDEDGIQYKEISFNKLNAKSSSDSEDDHSCYTKSSTSSFKIQSKNSHIDSHKNFEKMRIVKQSDNKSRKSCDIRINNAMDLKKCFEGSAQASVKSSKLIKNGSMSISESENEDLRFSNNSLSNQSKNSKKSSTNTSQIHHVSLKMHQTLTKMHRSSSQIQLNTKHRNSSQICQKFPQIHQKFTKNHQNSSQTSFSSSKSNIVDLLTGSSSSDSESLEIPQKIQRPSKSSQPTIPLKCPDCPMIFNDTLRLNRHKRTHQVPQFQCRNCLRKFKRKSMLKKHFCDIKCAKCPDICTCQMTDSKDCIICQKINFRYFSDYKEHMVTHHNEIIYCKICEKNNYTLFKHKQLRHDIVRSFRCTECTSILKSKEQLEYHMEIHAKNFPCSKCSKVFTRRYLIKQHELTHENPKQFHCEICDKNFQRKFCLEKHRSVIHNDKKKEESYLKQLKEMYGDKSIGWIKCDKCPALFKNKQSHKKHLNQAHF